MGKHREQAVIDVAAEWAESLECATRYAVTQRERVLDQAEQIAALIAEPEKQAQGESKPTVTNRCEGCGEPVYKDPFRGWTHTDTTLNVDCDARPLIAPAAPAIPEGEPELPRYTVEWVPGDPKGHYNAGIDAEGSWCHACDVRRLELKYRSALSELRELRGRLKALEVDR